MFKCGAIFNDFYPARLYGWMLIHYLVWMMPLLLLFAALAVKEGLGLVSRSPRRLALGAAALLPPGDGGKGLRGEESPHRAYGREGIAGAGFHEGKVRAGLLGGVV